LYNKKQKAVIRVSGPRGDEVAEIVNLIRGLFGPNVGSSRIIPSAEGGYHAYITVYVEAG